MEVLQRTANRGSVSDGGYDIDNSLKLEADNSENLSKTFSSAGNRKIWTYSCWFKRTELSPHSFVDAVFSSFVDSNNRLRINFYQDRLEIFGKTAGTTINVSSNAAFRDTSAWYHIVVVFDTTQSTASNRVKSYINGQQITSFETESYPAQNSEPFINSNVAHYIGQRGDAQGFASGYLAEAHFIDGQTLTPTDFGEYDEDSGIWKPKEYTGTYGTNGFYLDFADASDLGDDESGNGNDFTENNITAADQATDTPTNNFCTWNPLWNNNRPSGTISEGATQVAWGGNAWKSARGSLAVSKGKWYWEIKAANVTGDTWNNNLFGFASTEAAGQVGPSVYIGYSTGNYYYRVAGSQTGSDNWGNAGGAWSSSDTFGFALDLESSTKKFILYRNGSAVNGSGTDLVSGFQTEQFFTPYATSYNGDTQFLNFGGYTVNTISSAASDANGYGTFEYAPPSGYYALCTKNLAEFG